jgi:hypothetical protein
MAPFDDHESVLFLSSKCASGQGEKSRLALREGDRGVADLGPDPSIRGCTRSAPINGLMDLDAAKTLILRMRKLSANALQPETGAGLMNMGTTVGRPVSTIDPFSHGFLRDPYLLP